MRVISQSYYFFLDNDLYYLSYDILYYDLYYFSWQWLISAESTWNS